MTVRAQLYISPTFSALSAPFVFDFQLRIIEIQSRIHEANIFAGHLVKYMAIYTLS